MDDKSVLGERNPSSEIDLFSDSAIADPYPLYKSLRDLGPAVWLSRNEIWAVTRYEETRLILRNHEVFSSASGVAMDADVNAAQAASTTVLAADPPLHDQLRRPTIAPLLPRALREVEQTITNTADQLIDDLVARESFDGITDLAQHLPLTIVSNLVGLPEYGRASMLRWAAATFNAMGPMNERGRQARENLKELYEFCRTEAVPGKLHPDGWAAMLYAAADRGEIDVTKCPGMLRSYIGPSLDTTIYAIGHLVRLLGEHREQWDMLKADPGLLAGAISEALRLHSPARSFTRLAIADTLLGDTMISKGDRVLVLYAAANRDERKWPEPDKFVITRENRAHLAFGHGIHTCAGMHLARMEISAILDAMIRKVDTITVGTPCVTYNNTVSGYDALPVKFTPRT